MRHVIGQLSQVPGEVSGVWRIPNFLSLPEEIEKLYWSPPFFFLDCCWCLSIYPNGKIKNQSEGWVGIYLDRLNCDSPVTVSYSITARIADKERKIVCDGKTFDTVNNRSGRSKFLKTSGLRSGEGAASPSYTLSVSYTLKSVDRQPFESTLCRRLWSSSLRWSETLRTERKSYVHLKVRDRRLRVHREILELSSPVFSRMFTTDMRESQTGEVNIEDSTPSAFLIALMYAYSGDPKGLSGENVCEVYEVAHRYEFRQLRKLCANFMKKALCEDTVCGVIALASLYEEKELLESAKKYFAEHKTCILKTETWKSFKRDNPESAFQILEGVLTGDLQK